MKCSDLIQTLEQLAPASCACEWDNVGLLTGRMDKEVKKVMIALDATDEIVEQAVREQADLLLTHHPLIFKPLKKLNDQDFIARRIMTLIKNDISYYAMHTNFDSAPGCMADLAADRLGLTEQKVLMPEGEYSFDGSGENKQEYGIGKVGRFTQAMSVKEVAMLVKKAFGLPFTVVYGEEAVGPVNLAAVSPGAGGSAVEWALKTGAQVLITGDMGHHQGIDAAARNLAVIDAGHYGLEHIFVDFMADYLGKIYNQELEILNAPVKFPADIL